MKSFILWILLSVFGTSLADLKVPDTYDGCITCPLIVRQMAWSLDNEPTLWSTDGYIVSRNGGGAMWIANEAYGIEIGTSAGHTSTLDNSESRALLWRAYQRWVIDSRRWH